MALSRKIKSAWSKANSLLPLKEWARQNPTEEVTNWFSNKLGALEKIAKELRFKNKGGRIAAEKLASKSKKS